LQTIRLFSKSVRIALGEAILELQRGKSIEYADFTTDA
jgi:hypothetical protein